MKCEFCYSKINRNDTFCSNCGVRLPRENRMQNAPPVINAPPQQEAPATEPTSGYQAPPSPNAQPPTGTYYAPPQAPPYVQQPYQPAPPRTTAGTTAITLGIIGIVFAFIFSLVTYCCSIPGLVIAIKEIRFRQTTSKAGQVLNIIALCLAGLNSLIAVLR